MTPERLEQIRRVIGDEPLPDWASKIFDRELLAEVDRLRAAADGLRAWLTYMDSESEGLQFAQCDDKGRELGLWE